MRKQFGFSLVELMIAVTLGLLLMAGVMKLFVSSKVVFSTQQGLSRIQESGRLAIDFISNDVSEAAYYGCHRPDASNGNLQLQGSVPEQTNTLHGNFDVGIIGFDSADGLGDNLGKTIVPVLTSAEPRIAANVLVIRSANHQGLILNEANTQTALKAYTTATALDSAKCLNGLCPGGVAIVADCYKSRIFQVSELTNPSGNQVTINHADPWGGGDKVMENFILGAEVLPFNTNIYFLATSGTGQGTSLWQKTNNNPAFELLEGVEQMRVTYAVERGSVYRTATEINDDGDWARVWSVRVELLVRSLEDNILTDVQPYTFADHPQVTPTDRRMRQIFSVTTAIRSRMILN